MEFNYIALSFIYLTSFIVIRNASCIPSKFLSPSESPISSSVSPSPSISDAPVNAPAYSSPFEDSTGMAPASLESPTSNSPPSEEEEESSPDLISSTTSSLLPNLPLVGGLPQTMTSLVNGLKNTNLVNVPKKVKDACKNTDHPTECSASVAPLLKGNLEPVTILQGETKAFDNALEVAKEDMGKGDAKSDRQTVSTCQQMYDNAREEISKANELMTKDDKYGVNIHLSAALSFIETCKDEIPKGAKDDSKLLLTNKLLSNFASNSLALGDFAMGTNNHDY